MVSTQAALCSSSHLAPKHPPPPGWDCRGQLVTATCPRRPALPLPATQGPAAWDHSWLVLPHDRPGVDGQGSVLPSVSGGLIPCPP